MILLYDVVHVRRGRAQLCPPDPHGSHLTWRQNDQRGRRSGCEFLMALSEGKDPSSEPAPFSAGRAQQNRNQPMPHGRKKPEKAVSARSLLKATPLFVSLNESEIDSLASRCVVRPESPAKYFSSESEPSCWWSNLVALSYARRISAGHIETPLPRDRIQGAVCGVSRDVWICPAVDRDSRPER
jgi:hypothetical protein